jgi:hypothetical protein
MHTGYLMIELLLVLTLVTISTLVLMRYQARTLDWQGSALQTCTMTDCAGRIIEEFVRGGNRVSGTSGSFKISCLFAGVELPDVKGAPFGCSLPDKGNIAIVIVSVRATNRSGCCDIATCLERDSHELQ